MLSLLRSHRSQPGLPAGLFVSACISLGTLGIAVLFVGVGYLLNPQSDISAAESEDIVIISRNTRDIFAVFARDKEPAPARNEPAVAKPQNRDLVAILTTPRPLPRIKPERNRPLRTVDKSIDVNGVHLAEERYFTFADQSDFTGGKDPIFTEYISPYAETQLASPEDSVTLYRGESLYAALVRVGIRPEDSDRVTAALSEEVNVRGLQPGTRFMLSREKTPMTAFQKAAVAHLDNSGNDRLLALELADDPVRRVHVRRDASDRFFAESIIAETTLHYAAVSGAITDSLFASAERAGAPREVVAKFANLFLFDVDFQREIRYGDRFEAVYEVFYDELGRPAGYGDVVYARLNWRNKAEEKGYYRFYHDGKMTWFDDAGKSANRLLMKTPIEGARITSGFGSRRHPISGYTKQHKGVDFGAGRGTPIMAAGDGVIERANVFSTYGNYIRIRHANGYKTAYAHLNGFASGIRAGARVEQGQIIGYVGSTGASTGPHLHYEVLRNGAQINPMNIRVATGKELSGDDLEIFQAERTWIDDLRQPAKPILLAQN